MPGLHCVSPNHTEIYPFWPGRMSERTRLKWNSSNSSIEQRKRKRASKQACVCVCDECVGIKERKIEQSASAMRTIQVYSDQINNVNQFANGKNQKEMSKVEVWQLEIERCDVSEPVRAVTHRTSVPSTEHCLYHFPMQSPMTMCLSTCVYGTLWLLVL